MSWNLEFIGVVACISLIIFCIKIRGFILERQRNELRNFTKAIYNAEKQPLDEAIKTLQIVGISYQRRNGYEPSQFKLPKIFWRYPDDVKLKAKALITLVTNDERHTCDHGKSQYDLVQLFIKQARKNSGVTLDLLCELTRQAGNNPLFKNFFGRLPFAK